MTAPRFVYLVIEAPGYTARAFTSANAAQNCAHYFSWKYPDAKYHVSKRTLERKFESDP